MNDKQTAILLILWLILGLSVGYTFGFQKGVTRTIDSIAHLSRSATGIFAGTRLDIDVNVPINETKLVDRMVRHIERMNETIQ